MHKTARIFITVSLLIIFSAGSFAQMTFAQDADSPLDSGTNVGAPTSGASTDGSSTEPGGPSKKSLPDSFNVNQSLKLPGQKTLVPTTNRDPRDTGITGFLIKTIDLLVKLIGSVALVIFILGALLTIVAEGKEDRLEKGKSAMLYSLIGLVIAFFAFVIVTFVQSILF